MNSHATSIYNTHTHTQILQAVSAQEEVGEELLPLLRHALPSFPLGK